MPLFYSCKHTTSACVCGVCMCMHACVCLHLVVGADQCNKSVECGDQAHRRNSLGDSAWNMSLIFHNMAGVTHCREQMIRTIPNVLALAAPNMALMLVLIEELWISGRVIILMRVFGCTACCGDEQQVTAIGRQCGKGAHTRGYNILLLKWILSNFSRGHKMLNPGIQCFPLYCIQFNLLHQTQAINHAPQLTQVMMFIFLPKRLFKNGLKQELKS